MRTRPITTVSIPRTVQDGVALAESLAEVSEHDGWHRTDPFIDWSGVRKALTAYVEVILR